MKEKAYLTNLVTSGGATTGTLAFDLGTEFPWGMDLIGSSYGSWNPVEINAGEGQGGYYIDSKEGLKVGDSGNDFGSEWGSWLSKSCAVLDVVFMLTSNP